MSYRDPFIHLNLLNNNVGFFTYIPEAGRLMARYCIAYDSMKQFLQIKGTENLSDMVSNSALLALKFLKRIESCVLDALGLYLYYRAICRLT